MWLFTNPLSQSVPLAIVFEVVFIMAVIALSKIEREEEDRNGRLFMKRARYVFTGLAAILPLLVITAVLVQLS